MLVGNISRKMQPLCSALPHGQEQNIYSFPIFECMKLASLKQNKYLLNFLFFSFCIMTKYASGCYKMWKEELLSSLCLAMGKVHSKLPHLNTRLAEVYTSFLFCFTRHLGAGRRKGVCECSCSSMYRKNKLKESGTKETVQ